MLVAAERVRYDDHKVYRVIPLTEEHLKVLKNLVLRDHYDFWKDVSFVGMPVDIIVPPKRSIEFNDMIKEQRLPAVVYIEDVQKTIDNQMPSNVVGNRSMEWTDYHTLEEVSIIEYVNWKVGILTDKTGIIATILI